MGKAKNKPKINRNPLEQLLSSSLDQILGSSNPQEKQKKNQETVLFEGEEVTLAKLQQEKLEEKKEKSEIESGIDYIKEIVHVGEKAIHQENREIEAQLQEIMSEIKKLADSSKELQMQFKTVAVEQYVARPGKYHKSFFSWLLSVIRTARMKVEDSGAWLAAMQSKKKSREYWALAKKGGTSFSLSNERNVATQVG